jgi:hypothetical protein
MDDSKAVASYKQPKCAVNRTNLSIRKGRIQVVYLLIINLPCVGGFMAKQQTFKPGNIAPKSAQYRNTSTGGEVTVTRGEPFPPTPKSGQKYVTADLTKHKK